MSNEPFSAKSVFENPERFREQLRLPNVLRYSFVGASSPEYHARLEEIVVRIAGEQNIRKRTFRASSGGRYTAYKYDVYHDDFPAIEALYREVIALEGTRFVI
jgi:putative lipoic acid-binding regulatory protein